MKVCIVVRGGHVTGVRCLRPAYEAYERFYVLNDKAYPPRDMKGVRSSIMHSKLDCRLIVKLLIAAEQAR